MPQLVHVGRVGRLGGVSFATVSDLTLHYDYLLNSGSTIAMSVLAGPTPIFTRATDDGDFTSDGTWALVGGNDLPVFQHDPDNSNAKCGLNIWEQRIQIGQKTSDLADAVWTTLAVNADVPSSVEDDIFGTSLGSELACTATADQAVSLAQAYTGLTANTATTVAIHVKTKVNASFVQLAWDDAGGGIDGCFCNFELTGGGTAGTPTALAAGDVEQANIKLTTDGFYRCSLVGDIDVGTTARFTISIVDAIDAAVFDNANLVNNDSLIVNAIDVTVGRFITNHIPNSGGSGTTVTRAVAALSTDDISSWLDPLVGTFRVRGSQDGARNGWLPRIINLASEAQGGDKPTIQMFRNSANSDVQPGYVSSGVNSASAVLFGITTGTAFQVTFAYAQDDFAASLDGAAVVTNSSLDVGTGFDKFHIGNRRQSDSPWGGTIRSIEHWKSVRKPNDFLETT